MVKVVLFDFGGVIAEEGFREGLKEIGRKNGLDPDLFFSTATELVYRTGYVTGHTSEGAYWDAVREKTGIVGTDAELRTALLERFSLRQEMLLIVKELRKAGISVSILSDQTNWLDEINRHEPIFHLFDHVFNSYHMHISKRTPSLFTDICSRMGYDTDQVLFVDDNSDNTKRAQREGLHTILYENVKQFRAALKNFI